MKDYHHYHHQQTVDTISKLQWYLFSKFQSDIIKLLPKLAALKFKIFRSHFIVLVLHRACWNFQQLPSLKDYDGEIRQDKIVAIMTDKLPAPLTLAEYAIVQTCAKTIITNVIKTIYHALTW